MVEVVATTLDVRDPYTFEHSWRVVALAQRFAEKPAVKEPLGKRYPFVRNINDWFLKSIIGAVSVSDAAKDPGISPEAYIRDIKKILKGQRKSTSWNYL